jgi:hypothetical protein
MEILEVVELKVLYLTKGSRTYRWYYLLMHGQSSLKLVRRSLYSIS